MVKVISDSGSRIELPAPLMRRLHTHALGRVLWLDDGQLDAERLLIPLPDASGEIAAWCLALPFLRPAEVTGAHLGDDYLRGIGQVHEWLIEAANAKRKPGQALIASKGKWIRPHLAKTIEGDCLRFDARGASR